MYDFRSVVISVPQFSSVQAFSANPTRVSLVVASDNTTRFDICNGVFGSTGVAFINSGGSLQFVFPFRDYGPIIQQEIWLRPVAPGTTVFTVTELYRLPGC